jgi:hypothetical protein
MPRGEFAMLNSSLIFVAPSSTANREGLTSHVGTNPPEAHHEYKIRGMVSVRLTFSGTILVLNHINTGQPRALKSAAAIPQGLSDVEQVTLAQL